MRLTHAEIHLDYLKSNIKNIRSLLKPQTKMCVAVKANAYGNGRIQCARAAVEAGADFLAIATVGEGIELRKNGICVPLLMLSLCAPEEMVDVIKYQITPFVFDSEYIDLLDNAAEIFFKSGEDFYKIENSKSDDNSCKIENSTQIENSSKNLQIEKDYKHSVHLAIDSGMGRIGCLPFEAVEIAKKINSTKNLILDGMCTHFCVSDSVKKENVDYTKFQFEQFMSAVESVKNAGINPGIVHCCNSGAIITNPEYHLDMVRPGIIVYGYYADELTNSVLKEKNINLELKPVMSLVSGVVAIRPFEKGKSISYGRTYTTSTETDIAVIPVGYGDGFLRRFSQIVKPVINGKSYPICGRICMDQCMIDIGKNNGDVKRFDKVILFGAKEDGALLSAQEIADATGTIPYEIMTGITERVERVYIE